MSRFLPVIFPVQHSRRNRCFAPPLAFLRNRGWVTTRDTAGFKKNELAFFRIGQQQTALRLDSIKSGQAQVRGRKDFSALITISERRRASQYEGRAPVRGGWSLRFDPAPARLRGSVEGRWAERYFSEIDQVSGLMRKGRKSRGDWIVFFDRSASQVMAVPPYSEQGKRYQDEETPRQRRNGRANMWEPGEERHDERVDGLVASNAPSAPGFLVTRRDDGSLREGSAVVDEIALPQYPNMSFGFM